MSREKTEHKLTPSQTRRLSGDLFTVEPYTDVLCYMKTEKEKPADNKNKRIAKDVYVKKTGRRIGGTVHIARVPLYFAGFLLLAMIILTILIGV